MTDPELLFAADLARRFGISRPTAYRWLIDLERRFGIAVVGRRGRKPYTTLEALARVTPLRGQAPRS